MKIRKKETVVIFENDVFLVLSVLSLSDVSSFRFTLKKSALVQ